MNVGNFSGGRTSAFMLENLLAGGWRGIILFQNTGLEDEATLIFVKRCSDRWVTLYGIGVLWLEYCRTEIPGRRIGKPSFRIVDFNTASREGEPFLELFGPRKDLPNRVWRECTKHLKIKTMLRFLKSKGIAKSSVISFVGIRYDEPDRWGKDKDFAEEYGYDVEHPLVKWKTVKADVVKGVPEIFGFDLEIEDEIFGNCSLCFLKGPNKRMEVMRRRPKLADFWINLEKQKGRTFVKHVTTEQLLLKATKGNFNYNPDENFDVPCTCNLD